MLVARLLQVDQTKRPSCNEILAFSCVQRHIRDPQNPGEDVLLKSIQFPEDFKQLADVLPKPKYVTEPPSLQMSRVPSVKDIESRTPAARSSKLIMKEEYGALQLPRLRYPSHSPLKQRPNRIDTTFLL